MKSVLAAALVLLSLSFPAMAQDEAPEAQNEFSQNITSLADQMEAAEGGSPTAQYNLGMRYATGQGVVQDFKVAADWLSKSAQQDDMDAQSALGTMYMKGQGVDKNAEEAAIWYKRAANQGERMAQYNLGSMYAGGRGVRTDNKEAYFWLTLASTLGNSDVEAMLSSLEGRLSPADVAAAKRRAEEWAPTIKMRDNESELRGIRER